MKERTHSIESTDDFDFLEESYFVFKNGIHKYYLTICISLNPISRTVFNLQSYSCQ